MIFFKLALIGAFRKDREGEGGEREGRGRGEGGERKMEERRTLKMAFHNKCLPHRVVSSRSGVYWSNIINQ